MQQPQGRRRTLRFANNTKTHNGNPMPNPSFMRKRKHQGWGDIQTSIPPNLLRGYIGKDGRRNAFRRLRDRASQHRAFRLGVPPSNRRFAPPKHIYFHKNKYGLTRTLQPEEVQDYIALMKNQALLQNLSLPKRR
jgi:hypothetical protein